MVSGLQFFKLYMGVRTHFSIDSYNVIEKKCRTRGATIHNFEKRRDCKLILYFASKFETPRQASSFLVANFAYKNEYPFSDYEKSFSLYKKWIKNKESLTYRFKQDILYINEYCELKQIDFWEVFLCDKDMPVIMKMALANKIHIETLAILNRLKDFTTQLLARYPMWNKDILRIRKLGSFVSVDETKYHSIIERIREQGQ